MACFARAAAVEGARRRCYARRSPDPDVQGAGPRVEHPIEPTAETLWNEVSSRLKGALNESTFGNWFGNAEGVALTDDAFVLSVPNDFAREWIEGHFLGLIRAAVKDATGHERRVHPPVTEGRRAPPPPPPPIERP